MTSEEDIRQLKRRHSSSLLGQRGVSGVGIEKDDAGGYVLAVHLDTNEPAVLAQLPAEIEGHRIKYIHSGPFRKFPSTHRD
jgi:hypothetical protein